MSFRPAHVLLLTIMILATACSTETATSETENPEDLVVTEPEAQTGNGTMTNPNIGKMYQEYCVEGQELEGPWNNDLSITTISSPNNKYQGSLQETFVESGGVPTVIQDAEGRLIAAFQWFTCDDESSFDQVAVSISENEGTTWSDPQPITIADYPEGYQRPFDPTLALLEDGRIRIYYTSNSKGFSTFGDDTNIYSAISEDGINYTFEEGARFDVDKDPAYDSAVGYWDGLWHIITPNNGDEPSTGSAHHGTSEDGLDFEILDSIQLADEVNWTGNFLAKEDGLYFYGTPSGPDGNWFTFTEDGETWEEPSFIKNLGGDPAMVCFEDESCLAIGVMMGQQASTSTPPAQK